MMDTKWITKKNTLDDDVKANIFLKLFTFNYRPAWITNL